MSDIGESFPVTQVPVRDLNFVESNKESIDNDSIKKEPDLNNRANDYDVTSFTEVMIKEEVIENPVSISHSTFDEMESEDGSRSPINGVSGFNQGG